MGIQLCDIRGADARGPPRGGHPRLWFRGGHPRLCIKERAVSQVPLISNGLTVPVQQRATRTHERAAPNPGATLMTSTQSTCRDHTPATRGHRHPLSLFPFFVLYPWLQIQIEKRSACSCSSTLCSVGGFALTFLARPYSCRRGRKTNRSRRVIFNFEFSHGT